MDGRKRDVARVSGVLMVDAEIPWGWQANQWTAPMEEQVDAIYFYRSGWRRREALGIDKYVDGATGFISRRGTEERFMGASDIALTFIKFTPEAFDDYAAQIAPAYGWTLRPNSTFDYRHRKLIADAARGLDAFEASEQLVMLLAALPRRTDRPNRIPPSSWVRYRKLAHEVQELLATQPDMGLEELARSVLVSPSHLSRVFRLTTGHTISAYRNDLRVRMALELFGQGMRDLAGLAASLGFADHAHLTRTVKRHIGQAPSAIRTEIF